MAKKKLEHYLALPYTRRLRVERDETGKEYFVGYVEQLDGLEADGVDPAEARLHLEEAFRDYLEAMIAWGRHIPEPERWPGKGFKAARMTRAHKRQKATTPNRWEEVRVRSSEGSTKPEDSLQFA